MLHVRNLIPRLLALGLFSAPLFWYEDFQEGFTYYLPNNASIEFIRGNWPLVAANVVVFSLFLLPLSFRRKINWSEYGIVIAFFVSLFVEMYGIPLSIVLVYRHLGLSPIDASSNCRIYLDLMGSPACMDPPMIFGMVLISLGSLLVLGGWITLYRAIKQGHPLVTHGIYHYSRHPQYLGFILVIAGWFFAWPSVVTFCFVPVLILRYISVCRIEEREVLAQNPSYGSYRERVPFLI